MAIIKSTYCQFANKAGLTLIEVLVALTLLTVGLLGVALMQVSSISGNVFSREMAVATELSHDMLEKLLTFDYTSTTEDTALLAGVNHPTTDDRNNNLAPFVFGNANNIIDERGLWPAFAATFVPPTTAGPRIYTRTWTVTDGGIGDPNCLLPVNMKCILVTVAWNDKTGTLHAVNLDGVKVRE